MSIIQYKFIKGLFLFILVLHLTLLLFASFYWPNTIYLLTRWFIFSAIIIFMIFFRKEKLWFYLSIFLLTFMTANWIFYFSSTYQADSPKFNKNLKVLSYNVLFKSEEINKITQLIKKENSDIAALQEVTPPLSRAIKKELHKLYPYRIIHPHKGTHGFAILSKYPIKKEWLLRNKNNRVIAQTVKIKIPNNTLIVSNVHLASPSFALKSPLKIFNLMPVNHKVRLNQWMQLRKTIIDKGENIILFGDFNSLEYENIYEEIRKDFEDSHSFLNNGPAFTFPTLLKGMIPVIKIDYIFYRGNIKSNHFRVL